MSEYIINCLMDKKDEKYKDFHGKLMPSISEDRIIGVRVPDVRKLAGQLIKEGLSEAFMSELPHFYYEENNLHAFIISEIKDFDILISELERFLPYVDNWATCDSMRPAAFYKNRDVLLPYAEKWIKSTDEFTVRFGIEVMMTCFLDEYFKEEYARMISEIISDKYYINMMIAWYFATALAKHPGSIMPYIEEKRLPLWVHNKTISKAIESYRIDTDTKRHLRTLRIKNT